MILGIESSCDDSAIALFCPNEGVLYNGTHRQVKLHEEYGGVVPALASREHLTNFPSLLKEVQEQTDLSKIEKIAVTYGPGLAGCLGLGISMAQALGVALGREVIGVNHLHGHAFSPFIEVHKNHPLDFKRRFHEFLPHLGLIVSGGNTTLFEVGQDEKIRLLGQTVDDAAGEALDKGAKLLGFPYPGGAHIERLAKEAKGIVKVSFPQAFKGSGDLKFSFSGLKTALRYYIENLSDTDLDAHMADICSAYQDAVVGALCNKVVQALGQGRYCSLGLSGGVANNQYLRDALAKIAKNQNLPLLIAEREYCSDNAGMIAFAAYAHAQGTIQPRGPELPIVPSLPFC